MKNNNANFWLSLVVLSLISACCIPCNDPALIKPATTGCNTQIRWEFAQAVNHSNGTMTSSISIIPDPNIAINATLTDSTSTSVFVSATDTMCGIKCISISGGFGLTCSGPIGVGLAIDGKIESQSDCSPLTTCAFKTMRLSIPNLESYMRSCNAPKVFSNGGIGINAIIENTMGKKDTSHLLVQFHL
ncbi:MAG: hypothetical protein ABI851_03365 [Saprospiraceae bacterium]